MSFVNTLPSKSLLNTGADNHKYQTLIKFAEGVNRCGDRGMISISHQYEPCDVAVMLGWVHEKSKLSPHLALRNEIFQQQQQRGGRVVIADSSLFLYRNTANPYYYQRYSFDGVFPNTGEYCNDQPDSDRWSQIQQHIGLALRPWRQQGNHILVCLQRDGGWSMGEQSVLTWAQDCIRRLRHYSSRPIVVRPHPGDRRSQSYCNELLNRCDRKGLRVTLSVPGFGLADDLQDCWAVVNHNSSPAVAAAIEGVPVFVTDPARSQAAAVASHDISQIEQPVFPDRETWIQRLAQSHWSHDDLVQGRCWQHMRLFVK